MNNILSFNEYNRQELERVVYDNELNEGLRSFFNKRAARKVRGKLADEINMSKTIMDGIKTGLETMNDNFEVIKQTLNKSDNPDVKGEKQKALEAITKILEDSRKNTWDLKALIDEGEIDYTGFTANLGTAMFVNFGIIFTPFRAMIMLHKGYNYFFNIIKSTIRKALVMLQLNFDQFENLIISKSFQSMDYLENIRDFEKISEYSGQMMAMLFNEKGGSMAHKKGWKEMKEKMAAADKLIKTEMQQKKTSQESENAYNCLDQYNNTYTRSLETLRQYSQDDVQKHLDSIKTSISKLSTGVEGNSLQVFGELIIAMAEEHAYKVSSSIYNKFAKMTEVFSLPNQKKLIDLIQAANKEQMDAAEKERKKLEADEKVRMEEESLRNFEDNGKNIFKSLSGTKIGELDKETKKYSDINASAWTYEEFKKLKKDDKDTLECWLLEHPEVLEKCDKTLQIVITPSLSGGYFEYVDSLVDYVEPCITMQEEEKEEGKETNEAYIMNFDEYMYSIDENNNPKKYKFEEKIDKASNLDELLDFLFKDKKISELGDGEKAKLNIVRDEVNDMYEDEDDTSLKKKLKDMKDGLDTLIKKRKEKEEKSKSKKEETKKVPYINFSELNDSQVNYLKKMFKSKKIAKTALEVIGDKLLKDTTFINNVDDIIDIIKKSIENNKKVKLSPVTYNLLSKSIAKLKYLRNHDYVTIENNSENKKSEN